MNISDYINIGLFAVLLKFKTVRYAAATIIIGYAIYFTCITPLSDDYYYHGTALLNLIIGCILFPRYKLVALLSFSLIVINNVGLVLYDTGQDPTLYNNLSMLVIQMQILLLYIRALTDGHTNIRGIRGRALVWLASLDSFQPSSEILPGEKRGKQ